MPPKRPPVVKRAPHTHPYVRIDRHGLELIESELKKLGKVRITSAQYTDVGTVEELLEDAPDKITKLVMIAPGDGYSYNQLTVSVSEPEGEILSQFSADPAVLAVRDAIRNILDDYTSRKLLWRERLTGYVAAAYYGLAIDATIRTNLFRDQSQNGWQAVVQGIVLILLTLGMLYRFSAPLRRRGQVVTGKKAGYWSRTFDLVSGTTIATVIGTVIGTLLLGYLLKLFG